MLFNKETSLEDYRTIPETAVMAGFLFDYSANAYVLGAGTPVEVTGVEAVKEWIRFVLRTAQGRYAVYPDDFGARAQDLVGQKLPGRPNGYNLSELRRQILESCAHLPAIGSVSAVTYDGEKISCTVTLKSETGEFQEVIDIEP